MGAAQMAATATTTTQAITMPAIAPPLSQLEDEDVHGFEPPEPLVGAALIAKVSHRRKRDEKADIWRRRVSIPLPRRCERRALPFELHPHWFTLCAIRQPVEDETEMLAKQVMIGPCLAVSLSCTLDDNHGNSVA
jgi:hypothetical protein